MTETLKEFLSERAEIHAAVIGLFVGFTTGVTGRWELAIGMGILGLGGKEYANRLKGHRRDLRREFAYAGGGFLVSYAIGFLFRREIL